jgi:hypothetical protein
MQQPVEKALKLVGSDPANWRVPSQKAFQDPQIAKKRLDRILGIVLLLHMFAEPLHGYTQWGTSCQSGLAAVLRFACSLRFITWKKR